LTLEFESTPQQLLPFPLYLISSMPNLLAIIPFCLIYFYQTLEWAQDMSMYSIKNIYNQFRMCGRFVAKDIDDNAEIWYVWAPVMVH
jgi:hypothetical protein